MEVDHPENPLTRYLIPVGGEPGEGVSLLLIGWITLVLSSYWLILDSRAKSLKLTTKGQSWWQSGTINGN